MNEKVVALTTGLLLASLSMLCRAQEITPDPVPSAPAIKSEPDYFTLEGFWAATTAGGSQAGLEYLAAHPAPPGDEWKATWLKLKLPLQYRTGVFAQKSDVYANFDSESVRLGMTHSDIIAVAKTEIAIAIADSASAITFASQLSDPRRKAEMLAGIHFRAGHYAEAETNALVYGDYLMAYRCAVASGTLQKPNMQKIFDYGKGALLVQGVNAPETAIEIANKMTGQDYSGTTVTNEQIVAVFVNAYYKYPPTGSVFERPEWSAFLSHLRYRIVLLGGVAPPLPPQPDQPPPQQ